MLNGSADRSAQSSPLKISTSPVRATSSPIRAPPSPLKSSLSSGSGRQKSPRRCQFAAPAEDARDKCGASWLCRRGAGAGEESETERAPGPSVPLPQGCGDDAAPPPKNCYRLVMLGWVRVVNHHRPSNLTTLLFCSRSHHLLSKYANHFVCFLV